MSVEEYRLQMELLLLRDELREEEKTSIARKIIYNGLTN